jgi:hypothetical protein
MMSHSSPSSTLINNKESLGPLLLHIAMVDLYDVNVSTEAMAQQLYLDQSVLPSLHYTWPSGITTIAAPVRMSMTHQDLLQFYRSK